MSNINELFEVKWNDSFIVNKMQFKFIIEDADGRQ